MNKIGFRDLSRRDLSESLVIGYCEVGEHQYPICAWRGTANHQDPFYIYLARNGILFDDSLSFSDHTHIKVWAVWEKAVEAMPESLDGICKLDSYEVFCQDAPSNVLHIDAFVAAEPEEKKKIVLILKRMAYELFISSDLKELHVSLTETNERGMIAEPDLFEIQRESWSERSVGWGRAFKLEKIRKEQSLLGW